MGLFSALVAQSPTTETTKTKRSQSLELPSLVQLYRTNPLRLESTALVPSYALLSYSAVPVARPSEQDGAGTNVVVASKRSQSKNLPVVPELGVWNVCVPKRGSDSLLLLPESFHSSSAAGGVLPYTFALTVDLSQPDQVEPTVSLLQDALIRFLIARPPPPISAAATTTAGSLLSSASEPNDEAATTTTTPSTTTTTTTTATTSLYALRSVSFGLAVEDTASAAKLQGDAPPSERDRQVLISLIICARRASATTSFAIASDPSTTNTNNRDEYRAKQVQALLWYHLRRYAHALNATLCMVDNDDNDGDEHIHVSHEQPAVALPHQLAHVWRELALGRPLQLKTLELGTGPTTVPSSDEASEEALPLLYTPQQPHAELIESVVLRTATYPGVWDAAKESLWKILPPIMASSPEEEAPSSAAAPTTTGDEHWLTQLRDSVAAAAEATKTPSKPARKEVTPDSAQKDAAVSSFFESLLK